MPATATKSTPLKTIAVDLPPAVLEALPTDFLPLTGKAVNKFYKLSFIEPLTLLHSGLSVRAAYLLLFLRSCCPFADDTAKIPTQVAKLAALMKVSRPTMSRLLNELTSQGFISMTRAGSEIAIFPYKLDLPLMIDCDDDLTDSLFTGEQIDPKKFVTDCNNLSESVLFTGEQEQNNLDLKIGSAVHPCTEVFTHEQDCSPVNRSTLEAQSQQDFENSKTIKTLKDCIEDPEKTHTTSVSTKPEEENNQEEEVSQALIPPLADNQTTSAKKHDSRLGINPPGAARNARQAYQQERAARSVMKTSGIPDGPWLENGQLNKAFVAHTVRMWKESPQASFHKMADQSVAALVYAHFCKPDSQIRVKWEAFCSVSYQHAENLAQAKLAGIQLTNEDRQKLAANSTAIAYAAESNQDDWLLPVQPTLSPASQRNMVAGDNQPLPAANLPPANFSPTPAPHSAHQQTSTQNTIEVVAAVVQESAQQQPTPATPEQPPLAITPVVQFSPEIEELTEEQRLANMQRLKDMLKNRGAKAMPARQGNEARIIKSSPDNLQEAKEWLSDPILAGVAGLWARRNGYEVSFDAGGRVAAIHEREVA